METEEISDELSHRHKGWALDLTKRTPLEETTSYYQFYCQAYPPKYTFPLATPMIMKSTVSSLDPEQDPLQYDL